MIAQLRGTLVGRGKNQVVLDVGGVGYAVWMPERCLPKGSDGASILQVDERPLTLFTHLSVREDALELFGFTAPQDREFFRLLISINGIGPKAALSILSALDAASLSRAILKGDDARLVKVPGIGKKTAARIILELKEKVTHLAASSSDGDGALDGEAREVSDVLEVLESLGCRPEAARAAVEQVRARGNGAMGFDDLLSESLQALGQLKNG